MNESVERDALPLTDLPTVDGPSVQGRRIVANRYEILSRLGQGGMGEVWHAYDLKLRVDVALKSLRRTSADAVESLRHEVRTAREVISPNVCRIFDLVEADQELISMEYIDGITLSSMLVKKGPLQLGEARDIAAQFLAGLEAIHQAGLVHRDLKPENIMITRTGRVVVMDFGIAKQVSQLGGTIAGTVPYMSPEQLAGEKVDARSDVFSAGVVLAEMIHPEGVYSQKTREVIWNAVRKSPLQLADSPWKSVIAKAVAEERENRYSSAGALARALEEVTLRVETIEERKPYPGLASFTTADAEYFYGRELEIETVIKKLQQLHLMALIGPSGAGKTSFLRAGLIPALPQNWKYVFCTPGDSPLINLGQSLVPELSADTEAMVKMVRLEDANTALWLLRRWREKHSEVVLIVDRFEELFTMNNAGTQAEFAELVGHAALEADVRVLLVMRDDFLMLCHDHAALVPIFSELTGLSPLTGAALRRALVQPALRCNYRFEDETLIDEIISDIEKERGALPLMAFAASRLWEKRDRQSGVLTRQAYKEISGVAGALAQHAEQTMERIGAERQPIVREIFRNLITAQNTRAARDTEELISVFPEKQTPEEVLRILIDARLLTSFEQQDETGTKSRVEIIHESLLTNWPRLVRWQTQDADSAQLRDQLRQAAQLWEQRSRSEDLLWTGAAFREYQVWREHYVGGLTTTEEAFAYAMTQRAMKKRKQRRIAVGGLIAILLALTTVISTFWRAEKAARQQSDVARQQAVSETLRREAAQLLALGRLRMADFPTAALAYAIASLEKADTPEGRRFALEAIWQGPIARIIPGNVNSVRFSNDGQWLAAGGVQSGLQLLSSNGTKKILSQKDGTVPDVRFSPNSKILATGDSDVRLWSLPEAKEIGKIREVNGYFKLTDKELFSVSHDSSLKNIVGLQSWQIPNGNSRLLSDWNKEFSIRPDVNPSGEWVAYPFGDKVFMKSLRNLAKPPIQIGKQTGNVKWVSFNTAGNHLIASDETGSISVWGLAERPATLLHNFQLSKPKKRWAAEMDQSATRLTAAEVGEHSTTLGAVGWSLHAPPDSEPFMLKDEVLWLNTLSIHPRGDWLAIANSECGMVWPLQQGRYPYIFRGQKPPFIRVAFTSDGNKLVSSSDDGTVRLWSINANSKQKNRILFQDATAHLGTALSIDPTGNFILSASRFEGRVFLIPVNDAPSRILPIPEQGPGFGSVTSLAFSPSGRLAAIAQFPPPTVRIWRDDYKNYFDLNLSKESTEQWLTDVKFDANDRLITAGASGLRIWDLAQRSSRQIQPFTKDHVMIFAISSDGNWLLVSEYDDVTGEKPSRLTVHDLKKNDTWQITSHRNRVSAVALDPEGRFAVTGDLDGVVRIGPIKGGEPHLLMGHTGRIWSVAVSPDGKWIASASDDGTIRLWPMPYGQPFHLLPYKEFVQRLHAITNLRVVKDPETETGYRLEAGSFPGWGTVPTW